MSARDTLERQDARARERAQIGFDRPVLVEAGAGTGKTRVLVNRVVAWCLGPGWERAAVAQPEAGPETVAAAVLEGVVAITFTEAAAAEMERRIGDAFERLARGEVVDGLHEPAVPEAGTRRARAEALLVSLDALEVGTIHAFCRRLLARYPLEAGIHPRFRVDGQAREQADTVRNLLERTLRGELDAGAESDLVTLLSAGFELASIEQALRELLEAGVPAGSLQGDPLARARILALTARVKQAVAAFLEAGAGLIDPVAARSSHAAEALDRLEALGARLEAAPPESEAALTAFLEWWRSGWLAPHARQLGRWSKGDFGRSAEEWPAEARERLRAAAGPLRAALEHVGALEPRRLAVAQRLLCALLREAEEALRESGALSYGGLLHRASELLASAPPVCARERRRIDQLLVDEFQDTDRLQCGIVAQLALEGPRGERPGLFLVADPKQSIYGWRNADLRAYDDFVERIRRAGGERLRLSANYRSHPAILDEVERILRPVMRAEAGIQPAFQPLLPRVKPASSPNSPIEYWVAADWGGAPGGPVETSARRATELEARALARDRVARPADASFAWRDVALLLRGTGDLDVYLEALREAGIPFLVDRDRIYARRREVLDASALVRAVLDPNDRLAQVATLRSAWVGVPDAAWLPLWERGFPEDLHQALCGADEASLRLGRAVEEVAVALPRQEIPGLSEIDGWHHNLIEAVRVLRELHASYDQDPPERFVEKLRTLTLLEATEACRPLGHHRLQNLKRFFRELLDEMQTHPGDRAAVLRALRRRTVGEWQAEEPPSLEPREDAVRVLTIHKAKGLDFEHVYVLQLHHGRGTQSDGALEFGEAGAGLEYRLSSGSVHIASLGFDGVAERRRTVERAELVRTLYVAMTRARQRLVLVGRWSRFAERSVPNECHMGLVEVGRIDGLGRALEVLEAGGVAPDAPFDADGARWFLLGAADGAATGFAPPLPELARVSLARAREDAGRLQQERERVEAARMRPLGAPISAASSDAAHPGDAADRGGARRARAARVARVVGSAVHRFLERFDWDADAAAEVTVRLAELDAMLNASSLGSAERLEARRRAGDVLERVRAGPLWQRLRTLQPHVVARELPLLARPEEWATDAADPGLRPAGYWSGAIDLLYRDPASGEFVVVDFKTDRIEGEAELAERVAAYSMQGQGYARAVQEAWRLGEAPRVELWFLHAGRVVSPTRTPG